MRIKDLKEVVKRDQHIIVSDSTGDIVYMGLMGDIIKAPEFILDLYVVWVEPIHNDINGTTLGVII